jgi:hypothetical protein
VGFLVGLATTLLGEEDRVDLDRGVLAGADNFVLSDDKSNLGGGAIGFLLLEGA